MTDEERAIGWLDRRSIGHTNGGDIRSLAELIADVRRETALAYADELELLHAIANAADDVLQRFGDEYEGSLFELREACERYVAAVPARRFADRT